VVHIRQENKEVVLHTYRTMGVVTVAMSAISLGTRRRVMASVDIPSAESWWMSSPDRMVISVSALGVGGMVVLH
jgi:hypothetical protein